MTETATATLTTYITDMHALVNHGLRPIELQAKNLKLENHPEAHSAFNNFQRTLRSHLTVLETRATALGGKVTSPIKDAVTTVTGIAAGLISAVRPEEVAKAMRDTYTFISHMAIGYLMLHTTARGLGDLETTKLAEQCYRDAARMVILIDEIMPTLVIQELREDGLPMANVTDETRTMVMQAWKREAEISNLDSSTGSAV